VTVSGIKKQLESRFDLDELAKFDITISFLSITYVYLYRCADWLNVQTFDYRGSRDKIAEHHSALMQATNADGDDKDLNQVCRIIYPSSITYPEI